jgi:hypothetical protein
MAETHFFFTLDDHKQAARKAGLAITAIERSGLSQVTLETAQQDMGFDFQADYAWAMIVLETI